MKIENMFHTLGNFKFLVLTGTNPTAATEAAKYYSKFPELTVTTQNHMCYVSRPNGVGVAYNTFLCGRDGIKLTGDNVLHTSNTDQLLALSGSNTLSELLEYLTYPKNDSQYSLVVESVLTAIKYRVDPSVDPELLALALKQPDINVTGYMREAFNTLTLEDFYRLLRFDTTDIQEDPMPNSVGIWLKYLNFSGDESYRYDEHSLFHATRHGIPQGMFHHLNSNRSYYSKAGVKSSRLPFRTDVLVFGDVDIKSNTENLLGKSATDFNPNIVTSFSYVVPRVCISMTQGRLSIDLNFPSLVSGRTRTIYNYDFAEGITDVYLVQKVIAVFNSIGILALSFFVCEHLAKFIEALKRSQNGNS